MADPTTPDTRLTQAAFDRMKLERDRAEQWQSCICDKLNSELREHGLDRLEVGPYDDWRPALLALVDEANRQGRKALADESSRLREALKEALERNPISGKRPTNQLTTADYARLRAALAPPKET